MSASAVRVFLVAVATAAAWHTAPAAPPDAPTRPRSETAAPPKPEPDAKGFFDPVGHVYSVSYAPDGKTFLSVGGGRAVVWERESGRKLFTIEGAEFARFSDDGKALFYLTQSEFHTADPATGKSRAKSARGAPGALPGGRWAAIAGDGSARVELNGAVQTVTDYPVKGAFPALAGQKRDGAGVAPAPALDPGGAFAPGGITRFAGTHIATTDHKETACLTVWKLPEGTRIGTIPHEEPLFNARQAFGWSPDGKEIVVARDLAGANVYDAGTLKKLREFNEIYSVDAVAYSKDGKTIGFAVHGYRNRGGPARNERFQGDKPPPALALSPTAVVEGNDRSVSILPAVVVVDAETGKPLRRFDGFPENLPIVSLAFSPDGKELLCGAGFAPGCGPAGDFKPAKDAKGLRVLNLAEPARLDPDGPNVSAVSFGPDGARYLVFRGGRAGVFDAATGQPLYAVEAATARFSADGNALFALTEKKLLECDPQTGRVKNATDLPKTAVPWRDAVIAPDGKRVAADTGAHVGVYDVATGKELCRLTVRSTDRISEFVPGSLSCFSPDGAYLAATGVALDTDGLGGAAVWEVATGARVGAFTDGAMDQVRGVAFAPASGEVAVGYADRVEVRAIGGGAKKNPVRKFATAGIVTALAYSEDGKRLAVGAAEWVGAPEKGGAGVNQKAVVQVLDAATGAERKRLDGFERLNRTEASTWPVAALAFSPDGKKVLAGTGYRFAAPRGGEVKLFDLVAPDGAAAPPR